MKKYDICIKQLYVLEKFKQHLSLKNIKYTWFAHKDNIDWIVRLEIEEDKIEELQTVLDFFYRTLLRLENSVNPGG